MKLKGDYNYYIYILTNKNRTVLYTGATNDLKRRLHFHSNPLPFSKAFTAKYKCFYLLYFEHCSDIELAIQREKQIKGWSREKKDRMISSFNPKWEFLNDKL